MQQPTTTREYTFQLNYENNSNDVCVFSFTFNENNEICSSTSAFFSNFTSPHELDSFMHDLEQFIKNPNETTLTDTILAYLRRQPKRRTVHMIDTTELIIYGLLLSFTTQITNTWLFIDLPPGAGKTHFILKLIELFDKIDSKRGKLCVTTPTNSTANLFQTRHAGTTHSKFRIGEKYERNNRLFTFSFKDPNVINYIKSHDVFVFDEISMYGRNLLQPLLNELLAHKKIVWLMGDSCQLPPVRQYTINWYDPNEKIINYPFSCFVVPHENIKLKRLMPSESRFRLLILAIRKCIFMDIQQRQQQQHQSKLLSKRTHEGLKRLQLDVEQIKQWIDLLSSFSIRDSLSNDQAIQVQTQLQQEILESIDLLESNDYIGKLCNNNNKEEIYPNKEFNVNFPSNIPYFIAYCNNVNYQVRDKINSITGLVKDYNCKTNTGKEIRLANIICDANHTRLDVSA